MEEHVEEVEWRRTFKEDLGWVHLTWNKAEVMASDWRQAAAQCALQHGTGAMFAFVNSTVSARRVANKGYYIIYVKSAIHNVIIIIIIEFV